MNFSRPTLASPLKSPATSLTSTQLRRLPWGLLLVLAMLITFSHICIAAASYRPISDTEWVNDGYHWKQLQWLGVSLFLAATAAAIPYLRTAQSGWILWALGLALLLGVMLLGKTVNGSKRWIDLKFLLLQPSELVKLGTIIALANFLQFSKSLHTARGLIAPGIIVAIPMGLILLQPDLGTALVFVPIFFSMLLVAGAKKRHLGLLIALGVIVGLVYFFGLMKPYQRNRLTAFLDPEAVARTDGYHLIQSKTAIGAGGWLGQGFASGTQNSLGYLPENHTDFIFAVVGEEWGLLGTVGVITLYFLFIAQLLWVGYETREPCGRLLCVGVAAWFAFQACVNIGMTVGLMPITGLTLPFFSYGGSSLMTNSIAIGLVVNVKVRHLRYFARGA